jgi:3-phytase
MLKSWAVGTCIAAAACSAGSRPEPRLEGPNIKPLRATEALPKDPDDPAIWVNRTEPSASLVFGTIKCCPDGRWLCSASMASSGNC